MKKRTKNILKFSLMITVAGVLAFSAKNYFLEASSHREAPMIANDPFADNTDVYAFKSPTDPEKMIIIANFIPAELPHGGPNYYTFGENIRYEIHIKNDTASAKAGKDDITYRYTFTRTNEDPTTFFRTRLGKENMKTTYTLEKSTDGGMSFTTIVTNGVVPPPNIGPRSIEGSVGLGAASYDALLNAAITNATGTGSERVFCGQIDDPFFVDLGGIFDLGNVRAGGTGMDAPEDGLKCYNTHTIAMEIPVASLQKAGKTVSLASNILDSDYIIGVWASTSRPQIKTLNTDGTVTESGTYIQVSRLGMPLTNEVIIPIGQKDKWNAMTPYNTDQNMDSLFTNPELALYMDDSQFGSAVPGFSMLRIQASSLQAYDFRNKKPGLYPLKGTAAVAGTALADAAFGNYLLRPNQPRSVDILPVFHTGVPNLPPYQLAVSKAGGNPLAAGKPFINNFFPNFGDMLRVNMAVPATSRSSADFSNLGLVQAAVLGLTDSRFNTTQNLQFIPNMDGFPNGRRLEDDVVRIELQAVSGVVLAAIGLFYDDYTAGGANPVTQDLLDVLTFTTGVESNDTTLKAAFPFVQGPWRGTGACGGELANADPYTLTPIFSSMNLNTQGILAQNYPNPFIKNTTFKYRVVNPSHVNISIYDVMGRLVKVLVNENANPGTHEVVWSAENESFGTYIGVISIDGAATQSVKMNIVK